MNGEATCNGSYALGTACGLCSKCIAEIAALGKPPEVSFTEPPPAQPGAQVHQLHVAPRPPEEPTRDLSIKITLRADGMMVVDADKGIPMPILSLMAMVLEDFAKTHMVRGGT